MSDDLSREEVVSTLDRLVEEVLQAARVSEPPVDAVALASTHFKLSLKPAKRSADSGVENAKEQQQWLAAQQIGSHLKAEILRRLGLEAAGSAGLSGASLVNLFAQHLLAPTDWLAHDARALDYNLPLLHARYATLPLEQLAWRLLDLDEGCIITVVDNDHVQHRRSNRIAVRRELLPPEKECQRYVHHFSRPHVVQSAGWTVQGWPVHRVDWKREILRTVGEWQEDEVM